MIFHQLTIWTKKFLRSNELIKLLSKAEKISNTKGSINNYTVDGNYHVSIRLKSDSFDIMNKVKNSLKKLDYVLKVEGPIVWDESENVQIGHLYGSQLAKYYIENIEIPIEAHGPARFLVTYLNQQRGINLAYPFWRKNPIFEKIDKIPKIDFKGYTFLDDYVFLERLTHVFCENLYINEHFVLSSIQSWEFLKKIAWRNKN